MFAQVRKSTLYGKAHSAHGPSRKGALCATARMQDALFGEPHTQNALFRDIAHPECAFPLRRGGVAGAECAFPLRRRPGGVGHNPPPACGALWKVAQLGKRTRATPRQAAGGCAGDPQASAWGPAPHGKAQSGQRASLRAHPGPGRDTIRLPVVG